MTSALGVLRRVITGRCYGYAAVPLGLEYRLCDPVAIRITVGTPDGRTWHAARALLESGLDPRRADVPRRAAAVHFLRFPGGDRVAVVLRSTLGLWPVAVAAADLAEFLAATYRACPLDREAQLVADALDAHCGSFYLQGGNPA